MTNLKTSGSRSPPFPPCLLNLPYASFRNFCVSDACLKLWTQVRPACFLACSSNGASSGTPHLPKNGSQGSPQAVLDPHPSTAPGMWAAGIDLGFWMFVTYAAQAVGLQSTSAHDAALILTSSVSTRVVHSSIVSTPAVQYCMVWYSKVQYSVIEYNKV